MIDCLKRDYYTMLKLILEMKVKLVYDKTFIVFVFGIFTLVLVCVHCARAIPNVSVHFASQKQLTTTPTLISIIFWTMYVLCIYRCSLLANVPHLYNSGGLARHLFCIICLTQFDSSFEKYFEYDSLFVEYFTIVLVRLIL